mgnify:CR=1 FL=1
MIYMVNFGVLIHISSWRQQKHQCLCFHYWDYLTNFWRNNWRSIFDIVERLWQSFYSISNFIPRKSCNYWLWDQEGTYRSLKIGWNSPFWPYPLWAWSIRKTWWFSNGSQHLELLYLMSKLYSFLDDIQI